ncbi:globin-coupled sensor protein [Rhizobium halophytocola]|uniref:Methyl-accepting chemotaxis protein n=1 Tax=Rhizobium halophytocola TaxID=735519 RepID=A0ABS4E046_9HYPH|nr:globin-coupled sensor protein [Rhizobium halophytocola]MBP1851316.1 methyl-accepting chemotaxis protein [Rhizobium halophytocola]
MTDKTNEKILAERLAFIGLDEEAKQVLRKTGPAIRKHMGAALDTFYDKVRKTPETAAFFSDEGHIKSAKGRQEAHWGVVVSAAYDRRYVEGVEAVGRAHARIGLEPRWYIGGYALLMEQLIHAVMKEHWPSRFGRQGADDLAREVSVVVKAALLDMDYSISVYLDILAEQRRTAEEARQKNEAEQNEAVSALRGALRQLSDGDLESKLGNGLAENFDGMVQDYNDTVEKLRSTIGTVRNAAEQILQSTTTIAAAADDLSQRTEQQAAGLEESTAALHELTDNVGRTASGAQQAANAVRVALSEAHSSGEVVTEAVEAMGAIEKSSDEISKIIGVIDEIAFQTNLLALNAGVEAARAGEAGRGFAVVAQEVRELAQRCAGAAKQIKGLISQSSGQVQTGVGLVNNAGGALQSIIKRIDEINGIVGQIATAAADQSGGLKEVNSAVGSLDQITQQNAGMVQETSSQTEHLHQEVERLVDALRGFKSRDLDSRPNDAEWKRKTQSSQASPLRRTA